MAHGAVQYTAVNTELSGNLNYPFDLDGDFQLDFVADFDNDNQDKPLIDAKSTSLPAGVSSTNGWTLSNTNGGGNGGLDWGAPVAPFGASIDAAYAAINPPAKTAYLFHDGGNNTVGDWPNNARTEGYVGLAIINGATTNFGYAHLIYDGAVSPKTLTLVGYGYETTPDVGIVAGAQVTIAEPVIYTQPVSKTVGGGEPVQFTVQALADPAPTYQWQISSVGGSDYTNLVNNGHFSGVDTATLSIDAATLADYLDYRVVVSNSLGSATSAPPATLMVTPPILAGPVPSSAHILLGQDMEFKISVLSGAVTGYQWRKGGVNLSDDAKYSGTASGSLVISNLTGADDGGFDVVVTGSGGASTSLVANLTTVLTNGGDFEAATLANGPKFFYRLNETDDPFIGGVIAYDNGGGMDGVYGTATENGGPTYSIAGPRPSDGFPGFMSTNYAVNTIKNDTNGYVKTAPWILNTNTVTISAWIKPASEPAQGDGVLTVRNTQSGNVCGMAFYGGFGQPAPYGLGYNWNDQAHAYFWDSGIYPPTNVWSFVALVVTPTNATVYMITNDVVAKAVHDVPTPEPGIHVPQFTDGPGDNAAYIGGNMVNTSGGNNFDGAIDEVCLFNRSLSQEELLSMYYAARGIAPPVTLNLQSVDGQIVLTWPNGVLLEANDLTGPWTTNAVTSPYTNTPAGPRKFYRVQVQ